jgi:hypothetical protein
MLLGLERTLGSRMVRRVPLPTPVSPGLTLHLTCPRSIRDERALRRCTAHRSVCRSAVTLFIRPLALAHTGFVFPFILALFLDPYLRCSLVCFGVYPLIFTFCYAGFARSFTHRYHPPVFHKRRVSFCSQYPLPAVSAVKTCHLNVFRFVFLVESRLSLRPHTHKHTHITVIRTKNLIELIGWFREVDPSRN